MAKKKKKELSLRIKVQSRAFASSSKSDQSHFDSESTINDDWSSVSSLPISVDSDQNSFSSNEDVNDGVQIEDDFEYKLDDALDNLQNTKAAARSRLAQFAALSKALASRYCAEYFIDRVITTQDILERALKRSHEEAESAARALCQLMVTMASADDFCEDIFPSLYDQMERILLDHTAKPSTRAECATALGLGCFISHYGAEKMRQVLQHLLSISFVSVRGNYDLNSMYALKATCLDMFSFLVSNESDLFVANSLRENIRQLCAGLDSSHLSLRVAAGKCLSLMLEQCHQRDSDFELDQIGQIMERLQLLATDSQKSRSKKELKEQRSIFRQILSTVEGYDFEEQVITIADYQQLHIDSWLTKRRYDTFCQVLGSGMRLHLSQNPFLRDVFGLGPVSLACTAATLKDSKQAKMEKKLFNNFNRKSREMSRVKTRGKRADFHQLYE